MHMADRPLVLIVDDEDDFPEIIAAKLNAAGIETFHAKKPKEAVTEAAAKRPNLILLDINMPEAPGPELLLDLRQNDATKGIKVAFLTNSKEPWPGFAGSEYDVAKEIGADDFLQKTEDLDVLLKKTQALISQAAAAPHTAAPPGEGPGGAAEEKNPKAAKRLRPNKAPQ